MSKLQSEYAAEVLKFKTEQEAILPVASPAVKTAAAPPTPKPTPVPKGMTDVGGGMLVPSQGLTKVDPSVKPIASAWRGITNAHIEVTKNVNAVAQDPLGKLSELPSGKTHDFIEWYMKTFDGSSQPTKSNSGWGQTIEGITQFAVGMIAVGKVTKGASLLTSGGFRAAEVGAPVAASLTQQALAAAAKGAAADMLVFDAYDKRLANIIQDFAPLAKPVTKFLASDPTDTFAVAKLKQGVEGMLTGVAMESLVGVARVVKQSRLFTDKAIDRKAVETNLMKVFEETDAFINSAEANARYKIVPGKPGEPFVVHDSKTGINSPMTFATSEEAASEAGFLNMKESEVRKGHKVSEEDLVILRAEAHRIADSTDPEDIRALAEGTMFNFGRVADEDAAKVQIETLSKIFKKEIDVDRGGSVITHKRLLQQVADMGGDSTVIMANLYRHFKNSGDAVRTLLASKVLQYKLGNRVSELSAMADAAPENAKIAAELGDMLDSLFNVASQVKTVISTGARMTSAGNINVADAAEALGKLTNVPTGAVADSAGTLANEVAKGGFESMFARKTIASMEGMNPQQIRDLARRLKMADGDPIALMKITLSAAREEPPMGAVGKWFKDMTGMDARRGMLINNEYWMNALLSGTKTGVVNFTSNAVQAFMLPTEKFLSGVRMPGIPLLGRIDPLYAGRAGSKELREEGADLLIGNYHAFRDSIKGAWKALKSGENVLDNDFPANELASLKNHIEGDFGKLVRLPSRLLMTTDEFFKQMGYRTKVRADLIREATDKGLTGAKYADHLSEGMEAAFSPYSKAGTNDAGLAYAREATFTTPLPNGSVTNWMQEGTTKHPMMKVIMPFIRTPANILDWTWERTPILASFNKRVREDMLAGGARAAGAQAKIGTGLFVWSTAAFLGYNGIITGQGPMNPATRKQWLESHQPYSINIPGMAPIEYKRGDPYLLPFGLVADFVHASGELRDTDIQDMAMGFASSMANNFTSKTYLAGITGAMDAMTDGSPTKMTNYFRNLAGTYVPNVLNQINPDDTNHEIRSVADVMLSRLPGWSGSLPPRANIFGEPVLKAPGGFNRAFNPFTLGRAKGGYVEDELLRIGKAVAMPSEIAEGTDGLQGGYEVDMTSRQYGVQGDNNLTPYDRMLQLMSNPVDGKPNLRDELNRIISGPTWDKAPDAASVYPGGYKLEIVNKIIGNARLRAYAQVLKEFPLMKQAVEVGIATKGAAKGGDDAVQRVQELFKAR